MHYLLHLELKKKVLRNTAFFFFMKQIETYFESESYFIMVLLRNDEWTEVIWWYPLGSYVYRRTQG